MSLGCPHCGAEAPSDATYGEVYRCPRCGNPVLPKEAPPPPPAPKGEGFFRSPTAVVMAAILALAAAHAGVWSLLTAQARRDRDALAALHGPSLATAPDPGAPPPLSDSAAWQSYNRARDLWLDRKRWEDKRSYASTMGFWLGASLAAQSVLLGALLVRWRRSRASASRREAARA